jgi:hypothetical protein
MSSVEQSRTSGQFATEIQFGLEDLLMAHRPFSQKRKTTENPKF